VAQRVLHIGCPAPAIAQHGKSSVSSVQPRTFRIRNHVFIHLGRSSTRVKVFVLTNKRPVPKQLQRCFVFRSITIDVAGLFLQCSNRRQDSREKESVGNGGLQVSYQFEHQVGTCFHDSWCTREAASFLIRLPPSCTLALLHSSSIVDSSSSSLSRRIVQLLAV